MKRDRHDWFLLYFCPRRAALLLKASNRRQYGRRLLRSRRTAAGFFHIVQTRALCALETPHIVCVDVRPVVYFPGAVMTGCLRHGFVSVEEGHFRCLTFLRREDTTVLLSPAHDCSHVYSSFALATCTSSLVSPIRFLVPPNH